MSRGKKKKKKISQKTGNNNNLEDGNKKIHVATDILKRPGGI